jgi:signal transduction histidine kinase
MKGRHSNGASSPAVVTPARHGIGLLLVFVFAGVGTALMAAVDAYEWFYRHSRRYEEYSYDEIVPFMFLFLVLGLLGLSNYQVRRASVELKRRELAEAALKRHKHHLEDRVLERTVELRAQLEERERAENRLEESRQQLRRLSAELSEVQDRERRRIASELHDNIGHTLAIINNQLEMLKAGACPDACAQAKVEMGDLVADSIRFTRALSFELSSPLSAYLPLGSAIQWLTDEILKTSRIIANVEIHGDPEFPAGDDRALFFLVLREVFVNIVKHSRARSVAISVRGEDGRVIVDVSDDGIGFDVSSATGPPSSGSPRFGLRTVSERMLHLQGSVAVESTAGRGTSVSLMVPVPRRDRAASA